MLTIFIDQLWDYYKEFFSWQVGRSQTTLLKSIPSLDNLSTGWSWSILQYEILNCNSCVCVCVGVLCSHICGDIRVGCLSLGQGYEAPPAAWLATCRTFDCNFRAVISEMQLPLLDSFGSFWFSCVWFGNHHFNQGEDNPAEDPLTLNGTVVRDGDGVV